MASLQFDQIGSGRICTADKLAAIYRHPNGIRQRHHQRSPSDCEALCLFHFWRLAMEGWEDTIQDPHLDILDGSI